MAELRRDAIEQGLDRFTDAERAALLLANRYDGIDLPHDACRLTSYVMASSGTVANPAAKYQVRIREVLRGVGRRGAPRLRRARSAWLVAQVSGRPAGVLGLPERHHWRCSTGADNHLRVVRPSAGAAGVASGKANGAGRCSAASLARLVEPPCRLAGFSTRSGKTAASGTMIASPAAVAVALPRRPCVGGWHGTVASAVDAGHDCRSVPRAPARRNRTLAAARSGDHWGWRDRFGSCLRCGHPRRSAPIPSTRNTVGRRQSR
jgi:hypothetical protein